MNLSIPKLVPSLAGTVQNRLTWRTHAEVRQPATIVPDRRSALHRTVEKFVTVATNKPLLLGALGISLPQRKPLVELLGAPSRTGVSSEPSGSDRSPSPFWSGIVEQLTTMDDTYQYLVRHYLDPLFGAKRQQQLYELAGHEERFAPFMRDEKALNRSLGASVIMLGTALVVGKAIVPIALIYLPLSIYTSRIPFSRAYRAIFHERRLKASVLATIGIVGTWIGGFYVAGALDMMIFLTAEKLIFISQDRSREKLVNIFGQQPRFVWTLVEGSEVQIPFEQLRIGDIVVVGAGQMIPVDGVVQQGHGLIDQHRLTGEAQPAEKAAGERVLAATVVLAGKVFVEVEKSGGDTIAAQLGTILNNTTSYQMAIDSKALALANASVAPTLAAAGLAWLWVSFEGAVAVTTGAIGFNIRLTGPITMLNYLNLASQRGILVKDGRSLELLNQVDTVIFDKTGTLTLEQPHVSHVHVFSQHLDEATLLAYAAAAEDRQTHPIARAIVTAAKVQELVLPTISDARYEVGYGIMVEIDGHLVRVGSERFMALEAIDLPHAVHTLQAECHGRGHSLVMVAIDEELVGAIELEPTTRPEARAVVQELRKRHVEIYIISGDHEEPTRTLAEKLGVQHYFANVLPEDKAKHVERLQAAGRNVCFVGDGINDAIALKKAQVSVSLRGATTVATDTAQVVLMSANLEHLPELFALARQFDINMKCGFASGIIPCVFIIGGVFVAHLGVLGAVLIYNTSLLTSIGIAMVPLLQSKQGFLTHGPTQHRSPQPT